MLANAKRWNKSFFRSFAGKWRAYLKLRPVWNLSLMIPLPPMLLMLLRHKNDHSQTFDRNKSKPFPRIRGHSEEFVQKHIFCCLQCNIGTPWLAHPEDKLFVLMNLYSPLTSPSVCTFVKILVRGLSCPWVSWNISHTLSESSEICTAVYSTYHPSGFPYRQDGGYKLAEVSEVDGEDSRGTVKRCSVNLGPWSRPIVDMPDTSHRHSPDQGWQPSTGSLSPASESLRSVHWKLSLVLATLKL